MQNKFPLVLVCFLSTFMALAVQAQAPPYKVEGKNVIVEAAEAGDACAVNYTPGMNVKVATISTGAASAIRTCDVSNTLLGTAAANGGSTVLVPRDATTGYYCFRGTNTSYDVTLLNGGGSDVVSYRWLATPPDPESGIPYPYSRGVFNVRDFGAKGDGATEDTEAIRSALAYAASRSGGTVFFPAGDYIVGSTTRPFSGLTLPGGVVVQGTTSMPQNSINSYTPGNIAAANGQYSRIRVRTSNQRIFRIGECTTDVKIKNMTLRADPVANTQTARANTNGVEMLGKTTPSMVVGFSDVSFETFDVGFDVHDVRYPEASPVWQADFIKLDHCYFIYNKTTGVRVVTPNSDWKITNSFFLMPSVGAGDADGIQMKWAGAMLIEQTFAGGISYAEGQKGGDFLDVTSVGALTLLNSATERSSSSMVYAIPGSGAKHAMITFINNILGDKINFNSTASFFSSGNLYGARTFEKPDGSDGIHPEVQITSTGDRFCYDATSGYAPGETPPRYPCNESGLTSGGFKGGKIIFQSGQAKDVNSGTPGVYVEERPAIFGTDVQMDGRSSPDASKAVLSILADYQKILLELGDKNTSGSYVYRLKRGVNGWLEFTGTQGAPYRGYSFDAPVKLQTYTLATFPAGTPTTGTMVFCTDCLKNSSPCTGGGTGTLAILNGSTWECH
jgi:Pectate lyase superfamily protein